MQVANMLNIPQRTLMHWQEWGLVRPEGGKGRGINTVWTSKEIREASIIASLRAARVSMQKLRDVLEYLRSIGHNPCSTGNFVVINSKAGQAKDIIKFCDEGEAIALLRNNRGQRVLPLWSPEKEVSVIK